MSERRSALTFFAGELRRARGRAGLKQDQLASAISYSPSLVAMVETGKRMPSLDFVKRADEVLGTDGLLERVSGLVTAEQAPDWFRPWLELEREATGMWTWAPLIVQGLLQTEDYARAVLGSGASLSEDELEQRVATRMARQEIVRRSNGPMIIAVFDEGVLRRPIGSVKVMHDQLAHLVGLADRVLLQVVPSDTGMHTGLMGAFEIATFDGMGEVVYVDGPLRGFVADSPADVAVIRRRWEALRAEALPKRQSIDLILDVQRSWT